MDPHWRGSSGHLNGGHVAKHSIKTSLTELGVLFNRNFALLQLFLKAAVRGGRVVCEGATQDKEILIKCRYSSGRLCNKRVLVLMYILYFLTQLPEHRLLRAQCSPAQEGASPASATPGVSCHRHLHHSWRASECTLSLNCLYQNICEAVSVQNASHQRRSCISVTMTWSKKNRFGQRCGVSTHSD